MNATKNAPTSESRLTTAVPPPNAASARTPEPDAIGIARVSATIAAIRRSSLTASRGSSRGHVVVVDDRKVDVLQRRELTDFLTRLQARLPAQLDQVSHRQRAA